MRRILAVLAALPLIALTATPAGAGELVVATTVHEAAGSFLEVLGEAAGAMPGVDSPDPAPGASSSPSGGLYGSFGLGTGLGRVTLSNDSLTEFETYLDWGAFHFVEAGLQAGGLRMGFGWTGWGKDVEGTAVRMDQVDFLLTLFPFHPGNLFFKGGVGLGAVRDAPVNGGQTSYIGLSGRIGVGWEWAAGSQLRFGVESGLIGVAGFPSMWDEVSPEISVVLLAVSMSWCQ